MPRELLQRACTEIGCRDLSKTSPIEILPGRSCQETSYNLETEICTEILPRGLLQRSCQQSSYRDLVQRPGAESRGLARRSCLDSLNKDPTSRSLQRSSVEISYRHLVQIALHRDLAQQLLQRTSQKDLAHDLLQRSSQRNLQNLTWYLFLQRPH